MRKDQKLLELTQRIAQHKNDDSLSIYSSARVDYDGTNFLTVKSQLLKLLDSIIELNPDDFTVFFQFKNNIESKLTEKSSLANIHLILKTVKQALEFAYPYFRQTPKKIDRASLNSYEVTLCLSGAASSILSICDQFTNTGLLEKFILAKKEVIFNLAVQFIQENDLLQIDFDVDPIDDENINPIGNEIHYANKLFNHVAQQYGLLFIDDPLMPTTLKIEILEDFSHYIQSQLDYYLIANAFIAKNPVISGEESASTILSFIQSVGGIAQDIYRLYKSADDLCLKLKPKNIPLLRYQYEWLLHDILKRNEWLTDCDTLILKERTGKGSIELIRMYDQICVLEKSGAASSSSSASASSGNAVEIRMLELRDKNFILYDFNKLFQFIHRDLTLIPVSTIPVFVERLKICFDKNLLQSLMAVNSLHIAATLNLIDMVYTLLVANIEEIDIDQQRQSDRATALSVAAKYGHVDIVKALLFFNADPRIANNEGKEPLHIAVENNQPVIVATLLARSADSESQDDNGQTPLHIAASKGYMNIASILLIHDANTSIETGEFVKDDNYILEDGSPILFPVTVSTPGAKVIKDKDGNTPFHIAVFKGCIESVNLLIAYGADINEPNDAGIAPLSIAACNRHSSIAELLLEKGAKIDVANHEGMSPIFLAVMNGDLAIVQLFISKIKTVPQSNSSSSSSSSSSSFFSAAADTSLIANPVDIDLNFLKEGIDESEKLIAFEKLLSEKKLDKESTIKGFTVLHVAILREFNEVVDELEKHVIKGAYDQFECPISTDELKKIFLPEIGMNLIK